ncbi:transcriptional regulator ArgP [Rhodococcus sp. EPR-157]|jgi:LysR family transcriptional regulator (chromosome initiation inhibitor)|uniref:LysR family transcriptional regulator ArgP n=1 Tax=Rhodococcus sp. EPR-157 TaxID=1813677 RepID=UPI0007BC4DEC|nr:LysR family transcriptional regulator ArgP [Rhodococcus sp. EPR-157]KZF06525.1 transcriptional regulator ArgP [Rhodococcus sp. EPR-157]
MSNLDLPQLEALAAVVDEGSFDAAARRLHVTPSAISQRVKSLETAAGTVLLRRSKPVQVTAAGTPYLRLAHQIGALIAEVTVDGLAQRPTSVPIAVNGDSLNTWVLPALAELSDHVDFDVRREDQDHSAEMLRQGVVMAAVTTSDEPVQGCSVTRLGIMRYHPMCSPAFRRRWLPDGPSGEALTRAPMLVFDRSDDLQDRYLQQWGPVTVPTRRHYIPSSADFAEAVRHGIGWAVLPRQQCDRMEIGVDLVDLAPGTGIDVTLYWQQWTLKTAALEELSEAIVAAAATALD